MDKSAFNQELYSSVLRRIAGRIRRCIDDYDMILDGETIALGVSGGKDSLTLLCAMAELRNYHPKRFDIHAVTIDMGFEGMDFTHIDNLCRKLKVPYTLRETELNRYVFGESSDKNHCSICAKMRRGSLHDAINELGIKKIALAHHFDDAVETFLLSLLHEGRISCFQPVTYMDRADVTQIRPMLYVKEDMVANFAAMSSLPIVNNPCPRNGNSERSAVKDLLKTLGEGAYPDLKNKIFGAMQRLPLKGWGESPL